MSQMDVSSVLAQIRALNPQTQVSPPSVQPAAEPASGGFGDVLREGIEAVNTRQGEARELQQRFELGDPGVDLATVMLASSKSSVAFRGMVEVRNRLVSAYQEIMNMPI